MTDPISTFQQENGEWVAVVKDEAGVERWRTWACPAEATARLIAYTYMTKTPLRSHRVGGGYR
jgi:hypothetical protein